MMLEKITPYIVIAVLIVIVVVVLIDARYDDEAEIECRISGFDGGHARGIIKWSDSSNVMCYTTTWTSLTEHLAEQ